MKLPERLAKAISCVLDAVVAPCLIEGEPYAERSRKLAVICLCCISGNAMFLGVPIGVIAAIYDPNIGAYCICAAFVYASFAASFIPYGYLRVTGKMPQWMVDLQIWSTIPATIVGQLTVHQGPIIFILCAVLVVGGILRTRMYPIFALIITAGCTMCQLIENYRDQLPALYDTFFREQLLAERILYLVGFLVMPAAFVSFGINRLMAEAVERADQADAAIAMNLAVAEKLRRYDTDGVAAILAANHGKVDEKLLIAFGAIQSNLEEYRPHIPDYIIAATTTDSSSSENPSDGDEGEADESTTIQSNTKAADAPATGEVGEDQRSPSISEGNLDASTVSEFSSRRQASSLEIDRLGSHNSVSNPMGQTMLSQLNVPEGSSNGKDAFIELRSGSVLSSDLKERHQSHSLISPTNGSNSVATPKSHSMPAGGNSNTPNKMDSFPTRHGVSGNGFYSGPATTVYLRFSGEALVGRDTLMGTLNFCVEIASKHAKTFNGALQYMQGCGLMVSFNAASRVNLHEARASAFVLAMKRDVIGRSGPPLAMHASVVSSNVLTFFAGNKGQLMLTVIGDFMTQHTAMHHYLSQTLHSNGSCILLNPAVANNVAVSFETRRLGALVSEGAATTPVIELLVKRAEGADLEWMYQLDEQDRDNPHAALNRIVEAALQGVFEAPIDTARELLANTPDIVLQRCVLSRLQICSHRGTSFAIKTYPAVVLW